MRLLVCVSPFASTLFGDDLHVYCTSFVCRLKVTSLSVLRCHHVFLSKNTLSGLFSHHLVPRPTATLKGERSRETCHGRMQPSTSMHTYDGIPGRRSLVRAGRAQPHRPGWPSSVVRNSGLYSCSSQRIGEGHQGCFGASNRLTTIQSMKGSDMTTHKLHHHQSLQILQGLDCARTGESDEIRRCKLPRDCLICSTDAQHRGPTCHGRVWRGPVACFPSLGPVRAALSFNVLHCGPALALRWDVEH